MIISSSRIRELAVRGARRPEAAGLLGYRYTVEAAGRRWGKQLGRTLGFPTANMAAVPPAERSSRNGIYAVRLRDRADGTLFDGVASFGRRPTVGDSDLACRCSKPSSSTLRW
jgi:riboflavin kinase/FMN adenylyltransferase